jgi:o-succinylbenzoate synthase
MDLVEPLIISQNNFFSFKIPFQKPCVLGGLTLNERNGFYLKFETSDGLIVQSEASPLEGFSPETIKRTQHDLKDSCSYFKGFKVPREREGLLGLLRQDPYILNVCPSVRFAVESAILMLASTAGKKSLVEFLGGDLKDVQSAVLLQGTHQEVIADTKRFLRHGVKVFKLKVGSPNIALDVKKVQDVRLLLEGESYLRLDANRAWSLKEACFFAELTGNQRIDFIEEPLKDVTQLGAFYQQTQMSIALDETLSVIRSGIRAPGRCSSPLAEQEGVIAYVLKPTILGFVPCLDWIQEANMLHRKAIISAAFESPVGLKVLANMACLSGQIAGLGTDRWFQNTKPVIGEDGTIKKETL